MLPSGYLLFVGSVLFYFYVRLFLIPLRNPAEIGGEH